MNNLNELNPYRRCDWELRAHGKVGDAGNGCFVLEGATQLNVVASNGCGWDHLSVTTDAPRCPTWEEMERVRKLFGRSLEVWVQYGVPAREHVNVHPYCLHWWRPQRRSLVLPPAWMVG